MTKTYGFGDKSLSIDFYNKKISSINFQGKELIKGEVGFFRIKLRDHDGKHHWVEADEFNFIKFQDDEAYYEGKEADIRIKINKLDEGIRWGIAVKNHTDLLIEQVEIMSLGLDPKLKDDGGAGEIDLPFNEGAKITSAYRRQNSWFSYIDVDYPSLSHACVYPNMIFSPFMSYINEGQGLYLGMHDKSFTTKHIDFRIINDVLKTELSVFTNVSYGEDYKMDFDSVLLFFEGDYFDACSIYRDWFYKNIVPELHLKTIKEQYDDLPDWYHKSPLVVTYPVKGKKDSDTEMKPGGLYPYTNGLPVVDYYSKATDSPIMVLLMQWESTAPWAPPYVWPPFGDVSDFYRYRDELHANGHYLGVYTSGFGWTNHSYRGDYDMTEAFEKEHLADIMCTDSNGFMKSTVVTDIRLGYDICPALNKSKKIFVDEATKMVEAGLDYVQILDQNHGGNPYFCYSDKHGHPPAPGSWQIKETRKLLSSIDTRRCLLGCESAAGDPYIDLLKFSDNRYLLNYHIGQPIPMYGFIYHEFLNNFMGNQSCYGFKEVRYSLTYRIAYSFICGDMLTLIIDGDGKTHIAWGNDIVVADEMPNKLIKNLNAWRRKYENFLHLGKMVKPLKIKCRTKGFDFVWYEFHFDFDAVLTSAFTDGVDTYQFLVNYDNVDEEVIVPDGFEAVALSPEGQEEPFNSNQVVVPALSAIALKRHK